MARCDPRLGGRLATLFIGLPFLALVAVTGAGAGEGDPVRLTGANAAEQFLVGREVRIESASLSDLFAAGGRVSVKDTTAEDVTISGGLVRLSESSVLDLVLAGGEIDIAAEVREDLIVAGGRVRQRAGSVVGGYAVLAGGDIEIDGRIEGNLWAAGGRIRIAGEVLGDAKLTGGRITLEPGAHVAGKLIYRSGAELDIAADARVDGGIERLAMERFAAESAWPVLLGLGIAVLAAALIGMGLIGAVLHAAVPGVLAGAVVRIGARPWASLGLGFAILVATPVAANLLIFTLLGAPLGLLVLVVYCAALTIATITAAYWLGGRTAGVFGWSYDGEPIRWRILWTFAGLIGLAILMAIPLVGWLLVILALACGLGGFALEAAYLARALGHGPHGGAAR